MIKTRLFICLGIAIVANSQLSASINASDLLTNSPFVHARIVPGQAGAAGDSAQQYAFRGICKLGDDVLINISDNVKKKTYWIKTGETEGDIKVVSYDDESKKVSILVGSRDYSLDLTKPKLVTPKVMLDPNQNRLSNDQDRAKLPHRVKRVRKTGSIPLPPPSFNLNRKDLPKALSSGNNTSTGDTVENTTVINNRSGSSTSNDSETIESSSGAEDASTPPTTVPSAPPSYVPDIPDSVRTMMESNSLPGTNNSSN